MSHEMRENSPSSSPSRQSERSQPSSPPSESRARDFSPPTSPLYAGQQPRSPPTSPPCGSSSTSQSSCTDDSSYNDAGPAAKRGYYESTRLSRATLQRWQRKEGSLHSPESPSESVDPCGGFMLEEVAPLSQNDHSDDPVRSISESSEDSSGDEDSSASVSSDLSVSSNQTVMSADSVPNISSPSSDEDEERDDVSTDLYDGSPTTTDEAIVSVLKLFIKQHLTKTSLNETVKTIKALLPQPNEMPSSARALFHYLEQVSPHDVIEKKYYYCAECLIPVEDGNFQICTECNGTKINIFYEFPIANQIKYMFEQRNLADAIDNYRNTRTRKEGEIYDILDGSEYCKVKQNLNGMYDICLLWNSDGLSLSHSSKVEMWALLCTICEISPNLRSEYLMLCGIWCDSSKPNMNMYLKPFSDSLMGIHEAGGVEWTHPQTKEVFKSMILAPVLCADAPARAIILNVKQFNSRFGCNTCEQKAVKIPLPPPNPLEANVRRKRKRRFVFVEQEARLRTGERMLQQALLAEERRKSRKGVKGRSQVSRIPFYDPGVGVSAEYLHTVLLGCVKNITEMWVSHSGQPYYIGNHIKALDTFLLSSVKVPDYIKRLPRGLKELKFLKGSELRAWLLFYSLPCVSEFLPKRYLQHWILLVGAVYTLLKSNGLSNADLDYVTVMLRCFVRDLNVLYGPEMYTYNFHNLLHLPLSVKRWGPLWATSAFCFEDFNGILKELIHGTKHFGQELVNNIKISLGYRVLCHRVDARKQNVNQQHCQNEDQAQLNPAIEVHFSPQEAEALSSLDPSFRVHTRVKIGSYIYTTKRYDSNKKRANSFIKFNHASSSYGQILYFIQQTSNREILCLVNSFKLKHLDLFFHESTMYTLKHLLPIDVKANEIILVPLKNVIGKVVKAGNYLCLRPNDIEINL